MSPAAVASVGRDEIVSALSEALADLPFIHAFWEGGAAASGTLDEWSDLDLYLLVDDGRAEDTFREVERTLESLSSIDLKFPVPDTGWKGVSQAFYKLKGASEHHIVDLAVVSLSAEEKFLEPTVHGEAVFYFNKMGPIDFAPFDERAASAKMKDRVGRLSDRLDMFGSFFQKEIRRGNYIEAIDLYQRLFVSTLVELLRMKHNPAHYTFGMRHVHDELPEEAVERLTALGFVADEAELTQKQRRAQEWIRDLLDQLK